MKHAGQQLFRESIGYYIKSMYRNHLLTREDRRIMLLAINGLSKLNCYPLARVIIRLAFSYLTAEEYLEIFDEAEREQRATELDKLPF